MRKNLIFLRSVLICGSFLHRSTTSRVCKSLGIILMFYNILWLCIELWLSTCFSRVYTSVCMYLYKIKTFLCLEIPHTTHIRQTKFFVRQMFRHSSKSSSLLSIKYFFASSFCPRNWGSLIFASITFQQKLHLAKCNCSNF